MGVERILTFMHGNPVGVCFRLLSKSMKPFPEACEPGTFRVQVLLVMLPLTRIEAPNAQHTYSERYG
jgi:hypothetical protein